MNRVQTTRPLAIFVSEDWRSQYLPSNTAAQEEVPSVSPPSDTPVIEQQTPEILEEPQEEGPDLQLAVVLDNQQLSLIHI